MEKYLTRHKLLDFLSYLRERGETYAPVVEEDVTIFRARWEPEEVLDALQGSNSVLPPKDLFFPQTEAVFRFESKDRRLRIERPDFDTEEFFIFGMRACDSRSLRILDQVFGGDYEESRYLQRREKGFICTWTCLQVDETCFCTSFEVEPGEPEVSDLHFTQIEDGALVEAKSDKGSQLLQDFGAFAAADEKETAQARRAKERAKEAISLRPSVEGVEERLAHMFEDPIWAEISASCLGCGVCTYLCPTCHCYDLQSDAWGEAGVRFRCWDSCMFSNFTRLAGGENPRPTKRERLRNRYLHKFSYLPDQHEVYGCTGCGRCLANCPVSIDLVDFIGRVKEGVSK